MWLNQGSDTNSLVEAGALVYSYGFSRQSFGINIYFTNRDIHYTYIRVTALVYIK